MVNRLLQQGFKDILNEGYTARLEQELDEIEEGKLPWKQAVSEFDTKFEKDLARGAKKWPDIKVDGIPLGELQPARAAERCPKCGRELVVRFGRYGAFVGCTAFRAEPSCDYTSDLDPKTAAAQPAEGEEIAPCELCGKPMALKRSRFGVFLGCTGYPECKNIRKIGPAAAPPKDTGVACPECGEGTIVEKKSRRGKIFYSCSRYPEVQVRALEQADRRALPALRQPPPDREDDQEEGNRLALSQGGVRLRDRSPGNRGKLSLAST